MAATPRIAEISKETDEFPVVEILCDSPCQVVRYAADELQLYLGKVTGQKPAITNKPSEDALQFILGDGPLARAAGFNVSALPNEGYYIRRIRNRVYLLGVDDPTSDLRSNKIIKNDDRATLNAVYDFLERFLGVRFYFPHECGIIIPKQERLCLPKSFNVLERPDLSSRMWGIHTWGKVWEGDDSIQCDIRSQLQLRYRAKPYGQSNAVNYFQFIERFAKTHPEFFALMEDGSRFTATHDMDNWGRIALDGAPDGNLLKNSSLVGEPSSPTNFMGWRVSYGKGDHEGQKVEVDRQCFITQGQSLHLVNTEGNGLAVMQRVEGLKPETRYSLEFYIRTKDVAARKESLFAGVYVTKNVNLHLPST